MKKFFAILILVFSLFNLFGCNPSEEIFYSFGTVINVKIEKNTKKSLNAIDKLFTQLDADFDATNKGGSIYKFNNSSAGEIVEISADAYALLQLSKEMYLKTNKALNIATYPLTELWQLSSDTFNALNTSYIPPTLAEVNEVLPICDMDKIVLLGDNKVKKLDSNIKIGLGAVGKGYAGDKAMSVLKDNGSHGVVNMGGMVFTLGDRDFNIGIGNPRESEFGYFAKVTVGGNYVVCTSGDYNRYYEANGVRYHHILGKDGFPTTNSIISVSIISDYTKNSGAFCDALSTAVFAMDLDDGIEFLENNNISAVIITKDKKYRLINVSDNSFVLNDTSYSKYE